MSLEPGFRRFAHTPIETDASWLEHDPPISLCLLQIASRHLCHPTRVTRYLREFGRERANIVFGWVFAGHQLGAASAAFGGGLSRTLLASYLPAFFIAGALCMIAAAIVLLIGKNEDRASTQLRPAESVAG